MRGVILSLLVTAAAFAGCISDTPTVDDPGRLVDSLLAGESLWLDPQNAPHAAWGWPTLSSPPNATHLPDFWAPINGTELPTDIKGMKHLVGAPADIPQGGGLAMFGSIGYLPGWSDESYVLDFSEPTEPELLSIINPEAAHRGAAMIAYPDGRLMAVVSTSLGFDIVNLTDPTDPIIIGSVTPTQGGHKLGVVPGTPIVYNAASKGAVSPGGNVPALATGVTEIYDLTDPHDPVHVQDFANGYSCHHVYFWNSPAEDKYRAVCAGKDHTQIWDTKDPKDPKVIVSVPVHHGVAGTPSLPATTAAFSHFAILSQDGTTLIVGDEMGGGVNPPGCAAHAATPLRDLSTPLGALWFYDVSDETDPMLQGWFSPGQHYTEHQEWMSCTAHHGRLVPAEGRDLLAMAFYGAGTVLVDFTDPSSPRMVDQFNDGTGTWEVWYNSGYLFTGDLTRGFDVLRFE